jgi:hypothetical protein
MEVWGLIDSFHADAMAAMRTRLGDATGFRQVRLQDRDGAILDDARELEACVVVLAGGGTRPKVVASA